MSSIDIYRQRYAHVRSDTNGDLFLRLNLIELKRINCGSGNQLGAICLGIARNEDGFMSFKAKLIGTNFIHRSVPICNPLFVRLVRHFERPANFFLLKKKGIFFTLR